MSSTTQPQQETRLAQAKATTPAMRSGSKRPAKRCRREDNLTQEEIDLDEPDNEPPLPLNTTITNVDFNLSDITLQNYHAAKKFWPVGQIQAQLNRQRLANHQLSAAVIAEGQAVLEDLAHTIHMIAMVSGVDITKLKGLMRGTHGENLWHRWPSFAIEANANPMPVRGDPNSSGYPDYSSITITDNSNMFGDSSILVPEVPKLKEEEELLYCPIYEKLVDTKKVERDRKLNTPLASCQKQEKQSLQCMEKIAQELAQYHHLVGLEYYIIACSSSSSGGGWCRECTSWDEMSTWVETKAQLKYDFPLFGQSGSTIDQVNLVAAAKNTPSVTHKASNNKSDTDKKTLSDMLN
ncbi:uncharacterized protein MELLADRAFT_84946 [Melampsora larici-populina 98AG31]|uniref:Uncharacterized protein n=1 Tax=Melampsora larici-populina (strain 98AG31 / pathotype 3-4-7) TaxID=747676 RepID=F4RHH5_MELLP|nr:uncharacterized protein MELLADRAFT_84946 [Melampsora larici-populina 98AG31]EGG08357.1 hypothetical protein MELLADRAFT_84946 [Melampsora larici-populina 98AG31]